MYTFMQNILMIENIKHLLYKTMMPETWNLNDKELNFPSKVPKFPLSNPFRVFWSDLLSLGDI